MLCSVTDGDLPLTLKWYRHDQLLLPEARASGISITEIGHYESVLRIDDLRPEHNANFTCVAQNFAGIAQHSQTLKVKGKVRFITYNIAPDFIYSTDLLMNITRTRTTHMHQSDNVPIGMFQN